MQNNSYFILSIDLELMWGGFFFKEKYHENIIKEKKVVVKLLELFNKEKISATWACVGLLFYKNFEELKKDCKYLNIDYKNQKLSNYNHIKNIDKIDENYLLAPEIIDNINSTPYQEIASHTFSHFYTLEKGQFLVDFETDIQKMNNVAKNYNIDLQTIIFPRNQVNKKYFKSLVKFKIKVFRGKLENFIINFFKIIRLPKINKYLYYLDSHINIMGSRTFNIKKSKNLINIPESFFIYPNNNNSMLTKLRLKRIKNSMTNAAIKNKCIHLWFHPHNFSKNIEMNLFFFEQIINHYKYLKREYNMKSINMIDLYKECKIKN